METDLTEWWKATEVNLSDHCSAGAAVLPETMARRQGRIINKARVCRHHGRAVFALTLEKFVGADGNAAMGAVLAEAPGRQAHEIVPRSRPEPKNLPRRHAGTDN